MISLNSIGMCLEPNESLAESREKSIWKRPGFCDIMNVTARMFRGSIGKSLMQLCLISNVDGASREQMQERICRLTYRGNTWTGTLADGICHGHGMLDSLLNAWESSPRRLCNCSFNKQHVQSLVRRSFLTGTWCRIDRPSTFNPNL